MILRSRGMADSSGKDSSPSERFRALEVYPGETPRELYVRLKELFSKWVRPEQKSVKEISEMMILEQFLRMVNTEMEVWIKERNPKTAEEAHFSRKSVGDDRGLGHAYTPTKARGSSRSRHTIKHFHVAGSGSNFATVV
uniref:SCAN box domain-containing protein n=1 Tax=Pygocentrus nattereri TaxID=42514 RepID=A0AAR2IUF1_PYGNA